jgi:hypothetical protein
MYFFSKLTSKKKVIPVIETYSYSIFPEHFYSHGKISVFLKSGQKRGGKHSFVPPPHPHSFDYAPVTSLSFLFPINLAEVHNNIFECNKISPDEMMKLTKT